MAVVYSNPLYPAQVSFGGVKAASSQSNFRQMIGEVLQWNPNVDPMVAGRWLNNYYRKVVDMRDWYGLKLKGTITAAAPVRGGMASVTQGSPVVQAVGVTWPTQPANVLGSIVGLQFRTGFTRTYQTIVSVAKDGSSLTLDTPYPSQTLSSTGYQILECYVNFGANIKRLKWALNQLQGWPMEVNVPIESINAWDTWRTNLGWSTHIATRAPAPDGSMEAEIWPAPYALQVFPFEAYQQPPDLVADTDAMVAWIPSDLIVTRAIADALLMGGRKSDYYDPTVAGMKIAEFNERVAQAAFSDDGLDQQAVTWDYGQEGGGGLGALWHQSHE